jgi:hypothetical protein
MRQGEWATRWNLHNQKPCRIAGQTGFSDSNVFSF